MRRARAEPKPLLTVRQAPEFDVEIDEGPEWGGGQKRQSSAGQLANRGGV